jgi:hypothetical protein
VEFDERQQMRVRPVDKKAPFVAEVAQAISVSDSSPSEFESRNALSSACSVAWRLRAMT